MTSLVNFKIFRKTNLPILNKLFQKTGKKETLLNSFYEISIILREGEEREGRKKRKKEEKMRQKHFFCSGQKLEHELYKRDYPNGQYVKMLS